MSSSARWLSVVAAIAIGAPLAGCFGDGVVFYEVVRTRQEECLIRSNGEFCVEPDQFDPPSVEVWSVEVRDTIALLYVDEEVWVLDALADDADPASERTASKASVVVDGQSGCRTDRLRVVAFGADGSTFTGSLSERSVLTGPAACGNTPVGERTVDSVVGGVSGP